MIRPLIVLVMLIGQCLASSSLSINLYDDGQTFFNDVSISDGRFCEEILMEPVFGISAQSIGTSKGDASNHEKYLVRSPFAGSSLTYEMSFTSVNRDTMWSTLIDENRLESQVFSSGKA